MANTVETQVLVNGERNLVLKIHIHGDGSGEETDTIIVNASVYGTSDIKIMGIQSAFTGFSAELIWGGSPNLHCFNVSASDLAQDFEEFGGLNNNAVAKTGDILITTVGLGSGDSGSLILKMIKK